MDQVANLPLAGLAAALAELVADVDRDHRAVAAVLAGEPLGDDQWPSDPALAALCRHAAVVRLLDPGATGLALLADATTDHPEAAAEHLAWVREREASPSRVLHLP